MAKIEIEIDDHILENIKEYCNKKNIELENFATGAIVREYTVGKYGAVPKFVKTSSETKEEPKTMVKEKVIEEPKPLVEDKSEDKEEKTIIKSKVKRSRTIKSK